VQPNRAAPHEKGWCLLVTRLRLPCHVALSHSPQLSRDTRRIRSDSRERAVLLRLDLPEESQSETATVCGLEWIVERFAGDAVFTAAQQLAAV
jgi:hypothetical protein